MKLTKKRLEEGIIIRPDGSCRPYHRNSRIKEGELCTLCSRLGINTELKNDGYRNAAFGRKRISISRNREQAIKEAMVVLFYFSQKDS